MSEERADAPITEHADHAHGHVGHNHNHNHTHDYAGENQKHYDATAQQYDARQDVQELARRLREAMIKTHPSLFDEEHTTVMDYACGTGALSRELSPYVKSILGVDISQGMVDQYNTRVSNQGISPEEMRAVCVEIKGNGDEFEGVKFDLITCSMSYHHFSSTTDTTKLLTSFLKPGGSLLIVDIMKDEQGQDVTPEHYKHIVAHRGGFAESEIRGVFEESGLSDFLFTPATKAKMHGREVSIFIATGKKPF
ncbi:uncharacterized protein PHACADRAFT_122275 [Phanerochaete carnosa HHB-10118-sp]|uniref:Methyltransferase domain-containing protein n=1 Tax=Phanerochaete carnosa (strain HHB-10118-sp) TaxID=650164 RepID=K5VWZ5_PHACS|nr:uncharacterized protein PHACADRAFT_122275 [Phanerochaete carnosa HHB-10118-sp]EKM56093.1 hypothetical protein PHACADRAFT_122275 [Phanerochaete carnosa HHB-10118-sp]